MGPIYDSLFMTSVLLRDPSQPTPRPERTQPSLRTLLPASISIGCCEEKPWTVTVGLKRRSVALAHVSRKRRIRSKLARNATVADTNRLLRRAHKKRFAAQLIDVERLHARRSTQESRWRGVTEGSLRIGRANGIGRLCHLAVCRASFERRSAGRHQQPAHARGQADPPAGHQPRGQSGCDGS